MRESRVLCLKNMVGSEEVDEQLQEEIEEECSKYGDVENVIIYQERQSEDEDAEIVVKIFVEFGHPSHAKVSVSTSPGSAALQLCSVCSIKVLCLYSEGTRQPPREILWWPHCDSSNLRSDAV